MDSKKRHILSWKLYSIIDRDFIGGKDPVKVAERLYKVGVKCIQIRFKNSPSYVVAPVAKAIMKIAKRYKSSLIINDRVDVALASSATGVHLGKGDIAINTARRLLSKKGIFGSTVHSLKELKEVRDEKPDYIGAGPVFSTPVKRYLKKKGLHFIKLIRAEAGNIPLFAIGGINGNNIFKVLMTGCDGVCVRRASLEAGNLLKTIGFYEHNRKSKK